ncbi:MAG: methyltransferase domain-containing protein [Acidimicrobiales bacterium]|nr:methyltransferase domain-containing protein [Acidimicrobiales bacterium]
MLRTWPFWAPSQGEAVEEALDLAGVGTSDRLVDLGCGDGQVLLAASKHGASVAGIEADPELVEEARQHLDDAGVDADLWVGDLFDPDLELDADVFFAYLAPATLQRLLPALQPHPRTKLVTVDFDVPGLVPTKRSGAARLYTLPGRRRRVPSPGWPCAGTLVAADPECQSLSCLDLVHPGGPVGVKLSRNFASLATAVSGADHLDGPAHLAVDLRWEMLEEGAVAAGAVRVTGVEEHALIVVATEEDDGMWELTEGAVQGIRRALRRKHKPATLAELLDAATD